MYNSYTIGFLSLCLVLVMSACDSRGPCEKNYERESEVRACIMGSDQMAEQILQRREPGAYIPKGDKALKVCQTECHREFNPSQVIVGDDGKYYDELNNVADLFRACVTSCQTRLDWERSMQDQRDQPGYSEYEPMHGPGRF